MMGTQTRHALFIALLALAVAVAQVAYATYTYSCSSSVIYENSTMLQVQLCSVPNEAVFVNDAIGAYYINATTVELTAYSMINGAPINMTFTLINYYNSSQYTTVTINGNGTANVWSNETYVVFTLNNITFAYLITYVPTVAPPSGFQYANLLTLIPLAIVLGLSVRMEDRRAALGMLAAAAALPIVPPLMGVPIQNATLQFIVAVLAIAAGAIIIMERRET